MQIISKVALITINETLFIQLISFFVFLWIINKIMFRPLNDTMKERNTYLSLIKQEIQNAEEEIDSIAHQLKTQEIKTREEAEHAVKFMMEQGNQEAEKIIASIILEINNERDRVAAEVKTQLNTARKTLQEEANVLAIGIMEKILDRRIDA